MSPTPAPPTVAAGGAQHEYNVGDIRVVSNAEGLLGFVVTVIGGCCHPQATVTFSSTLIVSTGEVKPGGAILAHELVHAVDQAPALGWRYLPTYVLAIPGAMWDGGLDMHDTHPAERIANQRAGLNSDGSEPPGWQYPWSIGR
jgi:hypothetical protein